MHAHTHLVECDDERRLSHAQHVNALNGLLLQSMHQIHT